MDENVRMIIRRQTAGGIPTIPVSLDSRNGDWIGTDIYEGEFYQDVTTGLIYTRNGSQILKADGRQWFYEYKVNISQSGVFSPSVEYTHEDDLLGSWSYIGVGTFRYTATGFFPDVNYVHAHCFPLDSAYGVYLRLVVTASDYVTLYTYNSAGALANGLITNASFLLQVAHP